MSQEPYQVTPLAEGAVVVHEFFQSLLAAGFTEWQACQIVGVMIADQGRQK